VPKTFTGRIVYNRRPHLFHYSDVLRIVRKVEIPDDREKAVQELGLAIATVQAAAADVIKAIRNLQPEWQVFWASRAILTLLGSLLDLGSYVPEYAGKQIQVVIDWFAGRFTE